MSAASLKELYDRAAEGDLEALTEYARRLLTGDDCDQNQEDAIKCLKYGVKHGSGESALQMGMCYAYGTGVEKNDKLSTNYYRKSAELGDPEGMYRLFQNLSIGYGCTMNIDEADTWLKKAADQGNQKAQATWKKLSSSGMLAENLVDESYNGNEKTDVEEKVTVITPRDSLSLEHTGIKGADETEIVSEAYEKPPIINTGFFSIIIIYIVCGVVSGLLLTPVIENRRNVFNVMSLFTYFSSVSQIKIYIDVMGGVLGLIIGFIMAVLNTKNPLGMIKYIPALFFPLFLLIFAPLLSPLVIGLGKLLYGVLTVAIGLMGVYCVCASSSG